MGEHISLNNDWKYSTSFLKEMIEPNYNDNHMISVRLPHTNVETPFHYFDEEMYQFVSCYRRNLEVKEGWKGKQLLLTFEGVAHIATVYVNGKKITTHYGGYTAFTVDIEPYLIYSPGYTNVLVVKVDSRESNNLPPFGKVIDYLTYGGIYREVYLDVKEQISIEDVFVITKDCLPENEKSKEIFSEVEIFAGYKEYKEIDVQLKLHGLMSGQSVWMRVLLKDLTGKLIFMDTWKISSLITYHSIMVSGVWEWDIDSPVLYYLHFELLSDSLMASNSLEDTYMVEEEPETGQEDMGKQEVKRQEAEQVLDRKILRFGFRTCEFKQDGFYLNGRKVKLIGLNRYQSYPYVGYAMPKRMQERDAEILKEELKVNAVRTSHYPQSQHFINRCDELGLLVFTEIPGWQYIGDDNWKAIALENVKEMVLQYRNHPSIILWGVRINESQDDDDFYMKTNKLAKELDSSRQTGGVRYLKNSNLLEDVYTYNDFLHNGNSKGLDKKKDVTSQPKAPYVVSEFNGHMYPTKTFDDEEHRLSHALRHACVLNAAYEQDDIAGAFGWCMFDYNTHKDFGSGDRICYHGVMDMFRNPKLAAAVYASQSEDEVICEISTSLNIGDHPAGNIGEIYAFTNADMIRLYKNDQLVKEFYPNKGKGKYNKLTHPPIIIDDFIGNLLVENEHYSPRVAEAIKKVLNAVKKYGVGNLPLRYNLLMVYLMVKEHLTMETATNLYYRYAGGWGGEATTFQFEAIKKYQVVKVIKKQPATRADLEIIVKTTVLKEEETYDVADIRIRAVDQNGNLLPYYQEPIQFKTWGAIELIGPRLISLKGGMAGTYVKTTGVKGNGGLIISQEQLGDREVVFKVI